MAQGMKEKIMAMLQPVPATGTTTNVPEAFYPGARPVVPNETHNHYPYSGALGQKQQAASQQPATSVPDSDTPGSARPPLSNSPPDQPPPNDAHYDPAHKGPREAPPTSVSESSPDLPRDFDDESPHEAEGTASPFSFFAPEDIKSVEEGSGFDSGGTTPKGEAQASLESGDDTTDRLGSGDGTTDKSSHLEAGDDTTDKSSRLELGDDTTDKSSRPTSGVDTTHDDFRLESGDDTTNNSSRLESGR